MEIKAVCTFPRLQITLISHLVLKPRGQRSWLAKHKVKLGSPEPRGCSDSALIEPPESGTGGSSAGWGGGAVTTVRLETTEITQQQKRFRSIQIALKWGA